MHGNLIATIKTQLLNNTQSFAMTKMTKIFLAISLISFPVGFLDVFWGMGKPVGAIFFGLFMISRILEKDSALYDEEQELRLGLAQGAGAKQSPPGSTRRSSEAAAFAGREPARS